MTSNKSKPRSGSTSPRRRRRRTRRRSDPAFQFPDIYVDESTSQVYVPNALRQRGFKVWTRREAFPNHPQVDDVTWLAHCGRRGWIAITKDQAIKRRPNEAAMVLQAQMRMFVLTGDGLLGEQQAELVVQAIPAMRRWVREQAPPFMVRITAGARTELIAPSQRLRRRRP